MEYPQTRARERRLRYTKLDQPRFEATQLFFYRDASPDTVGCPRCFDRDGFQ
jgi:hypothetical protein